MNEFKIDPEFAEKIPPMPKEQFEGLRADILRDGYIRDPLVVWKEENTLLDGHHRWKVISEFPEKFYGKYSIVYQSLPDRWAAIAWICANQLHKHNMSEIQQAKLIQEEYEARRKSKGAPLGNTSAKKQLGDNSPIVSKNFITGEDIPYENKDGKRNATREILAKEHNISPSRVKADIETGRGIDRGEAVVPGFKNEVLTGEVKASKKDIAALRKMDNDEEVKAAIEQIKAPKEKPKRPAPKKTEEVKPWEDESKSELARTRALTKEIRRASEEMASCKSTTYTQEDLINELFNLGDDYLDKIRLTLKLRSKVIVNAEKVIAALEACERELVKIETTIGGKRH